MAVYFETSGRVLMQTNRGRLERGELIALVAVPLDEAVS